MMILIFLITIFFSSNSWCWQDRIIQDAKIIYTPISFSEFHKPIHFLVNDRDSMGGSAIHEQSYLAIVLDKGLLQSPRLTPDGLRMLLCHELGHLFGGAPRRHIPFEWDGAIANDGLSMMSSEGQADYYASLICFRKLLEIEEKNSPKPDFKRVGPRLKFKCEVEGEFHDKELEYCLRAGLAGEDFLKVTYDFPISCETSDDSISDELIRDSYPGRQCRLDTILAGAQCDDSQPLALDFYFMEKNSCTKIYAERPACWYKD